MIKKMRLKFFWVTAAIVIVLLTALCSAILLAEYVRVISFDQRPRPQFPQFDIDGAGEFAHQLHVETFHELIVTVLSAGTAALVLLLVLVWVLSFWIVRPAEQSLKKQRRFISEASHELKTPLTIISAGVELLQAQKNSTEAGKWLEDIKQQTQRLSTMTADLLTLSKLDETAVSQTAEFDISQTILAETLTFETVAFEKHKEFVCEIQEGIAYKGSTKAVAQAVGILCDNAIKHSGEKAAISVTLTGANAKPVLTVRNTGAQLKQEEVPYLFERFYRGSESRSGTPGTGLGLAILKAIADKNKWKIEAQTADDRITFTLTF